MSKWGEEMREIFAPGDYLAPCYWPAEDEEDRRLLNHQLNHQVHEAENAKWSLCLRYFTNLAYLIGNQYATFLWNTDTNTLSYTETSAKASLPGGIEQAIPRTVDNQMIDSYANLIALETEVRPEPRITPASDSPEDEDTAAIGEIVHDLDWEGINMPFHQRQIAASHFITGTAIFEVDVGDGALSKGMRYEMREEEGIGGEMVEMEVPTGEEGYGYEQKLRGRMFTPFHWQPDPGADDDNDKLEWCYTHYYASRGWIWENFGPSKEEGRTKANGWYLEKIEDIPQSNGIQFPIYWWERVKDLIETPEGWTQFAQRLSNSGAGFSANQCLVRIWDMKPNHRFPKGRTIIQADDFLVYCSRASEKNTDADGARGVYELDDGSLSDRWHKYAISRYWTILGRFWGTPLGSQVLPLQKKVNAIDSLEQMFRELATIGQWLLPRQARVVDGMLGGLPGAVIEYTATASGAKPEKIRPESYPEALFGHRGVAVAGIKQLSGTADGSEGVAPSGMRAGIMLEMMQKKERMGRSPMLQDFEECCVVVARNILIERALLMRETEDPKFMARLTAAARDRASHVALVTFETTSLLQNLNISVDLAAALLRSPEAKRQNAIEAFSAFGPNMSAAERATAFEVIGIDEFTIRDTSDFRRAKRMIAVVTAGEIDAMKPLPGVDEPSIFRDLLKAEIQSDRMVTYEDAVQTRLMEFHTFYRDMAAQAEAEMMARAMAAQNGWGKQEFTGRRGGLAMFDWPA